MDWGPGFPAGHWPMVVLSFWQYKPPHLVLSEQIHEKRSQEKRERERETERERERERERRELVRWKSQSFITLPQK